MPYAEKENDIKRKDSLQLPHPQPLEDNTMTGQEAVSKNTFPTIAALFSVGNLRHSQDK